MKTEIKNVISINANPCPKCGGGRFLYHPPQERKKYMGKVIIGKYECVICKWQSGLAGEIGE